MPLRARELPFPSLAAARFAGRDGLLVVLAARQHGPTIDFFLMNFKSRRHPVFAPLAFLVCPA